VSFKRGEGGEEGEPQILRPGVWKGRADVINGMKSEEQEENRALK